MAPKPKTTAVAPQPTKAKAAPTGLQMSAAQWKAYNLAYTATANAGYRKLAIQASAKGLQQGRLKAAATLRVKTATAHRASRAAAIAAFATKQSFRQANLAHQNMALRNRVFADYMRHVQLAAQKKYVYKGIRAYSHQATMATLTNAQATALATANYATNAAKAAVKATPANPPAAQSPASLRVQAAAKAAGLAAAAKVPAGRTAPHPVIGYRPRFTNEGFGYPEGRDCVAAAIANHLLAVKGVRLTPWHYSTLVLAIGPEPTLKSALTRVLDRPPWGSYDGFYLADFQPVDVSARTATIIGFTTTEGLPHAAFCPSPAYISSWGENLPLRCVMEGDVEEAWALAWQM